MSYLEKKYGMKTVVAPHCNMTTSRPPDDDTTEAIKAIRDGVRGLMDLYMSVPGSCNGSYELVSELSIDVSVNLVHLIQIRPINLNSFPTQKDSTLFLLYEGHACELLLRTPDLGRLRKPTGANSRWTEEQTANFKEHKERILSNWKKMREKYSGTYLDGKIWNEKSREVCSNLITSSCYLPKDKS